MCETKEYRSAAEMVEGGRPSVQILGGVLREDPRRAGQDGDPVGALL